MVKERRKINLLKCWRQNDLLWANVEQGLERDMFAVWKTEGVTTSARTALAPGPPSPPPSHYPSWVYFIALIAVWNYLGYSLLSYSSSTSLECKLHESSGFVCLIRPLDCQGLQQCLACQVPHKCEWMNQRQRQSQITCVLGEGTHCPFWTILLAEANHRPAKPNTNGMEGTCCL